MLRLDGDSLVVVCMPFCCGGGCCCWLLSMEWPLCVFVVLLFGVGGLWVVTVFAVMDLGLVAMMIDDELCDRPIGGTELLFEREFVDVERVARKNSTQ